MRAAPLLAPAAALLALGACGTGESRNMTVDEVAAELRNVRVEPGLWDVSSEVLDATGPNLPRRAQAEIRRHRPSVRNCITAEQAAHPELNFLRTQRDGHCTYRGFSMRDGRMRGEMRCAGGGMPGIVTTSMDGLYGPRSHDVRMRMTSTGMPQGANMIIETRTIGRRIGACPPAAPPPPTKGEPT